jgi:hypothetical protein
MDGPQAEALIVRRESPLQLLIVDDATAVLVGNLEAGDDIGIGAGREGGGHQRGERGVALRRWGVGGCCRGLVLRGLVVVGRGGGRGAVGLGPVWRLPVRLWWRWRAVRGGVTLWWWRCTVRGRAVGLTSMLLRRRRRRSVAVAGRMVWVA